MFPKYVFALCALMLFVVVVTAQEEPKQPDDDVESRGLIDGAINILEDAFVGAAKNCLKEAAKHCKKFLIRPKKLISCAKDYFKENQAECVLPDL